MGVADHLVIALVLILELQYHVNLGNRIIIVRLSYSNGYEFHGHVLLFVLGYYFSQKLKANEL